jgi:hypothetical protein
MMLALLFPYSSEQQYLVCTSTVATGTSISKDNPPVITAGMFYNVEQMIDRVGRWHTFTSTECSLKVR